MVFLDAGRKIATGGHSHLVRIWDGATGKQAGTLTAPANIVALASFNGELAVVTYPQFGASTGDVSLWDLQTGKVNRILDGSRTMNVLATSTDSALLAGGNQDGFVVVWDWRTGKVRQRFRAHPSEAVAIAFSGDGKTLATATRNNVRVWDVGSGKQLFERVLRRCAFTRRLPDTLNTL